MQDHVKSVSVLFCCMGNICRSPTAEGVFRRQVTSAGLANRIRIDSAGTHAYHIGHAPDPRSQAAAAARGYELGNLRARQVAQQDFAEFDFILAMDKGNLADLTRLSGFALLKTVTY
jgi:protein-tyrosine phosphatase